MKKFLSVISLMLVALMVIAIPAVSAEEIVIEKPEGINIHYATDVSDSTPFVDGAISAGEYGEPIRIEAPKAVKNSDWGASWETGSYDETLASEYMDVYFAYDDENIYFAFEELGAAPTNIEDDDVNTWNNVPFRNNYRFNFGFEPDNIGNYIQADSGDTRAWNELTYFVFGSQSGQNGAILSQMAPEVIVARYDAATGNTVAFGDLISANGNANYNGGQWKLVAEFRFEKAEIVKAWNEFYYTEYNTLPDAMWIGLTTNAFRCITPDWDHTFQSQYFKWLGQNDITGCAEDYADYGVSSSATSMFDLVVFGEACTEGLKHVGGTATCAAKKVCDNCGESYGEVDAENHIGAAEWEKTATKHAKKYACCDTVVVEEENHEWTDGACTECGYTCAHTGETGTCGVCGKVLTTVTPSTDTETDPVTTEPATTEPAVTEPSTEAPTTEAPATTAPNTDPVPEPAGGCGSTVGLAGLALVAALGTCTVFVAKKKED